MDSVPYTLVPRNLEIMGLLIWKSTTLNILLLQPPGVFGFPHIPFPAHLPAELRTLQATGQMPLLVKVFCDSDFRSDHKCKYLLFHERVSLPSIAAMPSSVFYTATLRVDCNTGVFETRDKSTLDWYCINRWLQGHYSISFSTGNFNPQWCPSVRHKLGH